MRRTLVTILPMLAALLACHWPGGAAYGQTRARMAREAAEAVAARFGAKAGSAATLAARIERYAARHGDQVVEAVRKVGPRGFALVDAAGANGARAAGVLARHGEAGAAHVLMRPRAMSQLLRFGDDAARALVKHPGVAEGVIERGGVAAVKALSAVTPQGGRRLAMVLEGELARHPAAHQELLGVVGRFGQPAADFVWRNKGALAVGATLTAFLAKPEAFIHGACDLASVAGDSVAKPLAAGVARGIAEGVNWNVIVLVCLAAAGGVLAWVVVRLGLLRTLLRPAGPSVPAGEAREQIAPYSEQRHG